MHISNFIRNFTNHPVLFVGTGMSLRYLENSFTWDGLLSYISNKIKGSDEFYYDLKSKHEKNGEYDYSKIAKDLEKEFNDVLMSDRNGQFKEINDKFYENMKNHINISRFKLYISQLLSNYIIKDSQQHEISELKKVRKNIGSVITTNYDSFIEDIFEFKELIGNEILLSNPYGSVYKIHGCVKDPSKIIITDDDYGVFDEKYELIRAQLLSLFIHNPIIFLGYNIGDNNIKGILKTIFTYINPNTPQAEKIRKNFLLVEHDKGSQNTEVTDHDIDMSGFSTIRINKIKTDNFLEIYKHLADLNLPVSAMDIRKVQNIVKEIYAGGNIEVSVTEDVDALKNEEKVLAIGSLKTITYEFQTKAELMENYFKIIDESNHQLLKLIDKHKFQKNQYFPIYAFSKIQSELESSVELKGNQNEKITNIINNATDFAQEHTSISGILQDDNIVQSKKNLAIVLGIINDRIQLDTVEEHLRTYSDKKSTDYRKILCVYDYKKYADEHEMINLASSGGSIVS
ncbi:SIR2 family protein [Bacillus thuringiensis]|uniref:SIR2 family protein n=1 Tax=Bacillus thuringiensis TaxID=1428 RepID=UPI000BF9A18E|nr:SIR2 family protein [Bacillus thuringiensis]PEY85521.1 SIR2 family protein [Bacillus thuringiensis]PFI41172.1 SIR2 family protein [Bacillus thuringiensis]